MQLPQRYVGVVQVFARGEQAARRRILRPLPVALALAALAASFRGDDVDTTAPNRSAALVELLALRGIACTEDDVTWIDGPHGATGAITGGARALVRASAHGEPSDLYLVDPRLS